MQRITIQEKFTANWTGCSKLGAARRAGIPRVVAAAKGRAHGKNRLGLVASQPTASADVCCLRAGCKFNYRPPWCAIIAFFTLKSITPPPLVWFAKEFEHSRLSIIHKKQKRFNFTIVSVFINTKLEQLTAVRTRNKSLLTRWKKEDASLLIFLIVCTRFQPVAFFFLFSPYPFTFDLYLKDSLLLSWDEFMSHWTKTLQFTQVFILYWSLDTPVPSQYFKLKNLEIR